MIVLFEGSPRAVAEQADELGGREVAAWPGVRALQRDLPGRVRWDGSAAPLIRPGPRVAYVETPGDEPWSALAERVVEALCSPS